jgi:hypothetical protein
MASYDETRLVFSFERGQNFREYVGAHITSAEHFSRFERGRVEIKVID